VNADEALEITNSLAELSSVLTSLHLAAVELSNENFELKQRLRAGNDLQAFKAQYRLLETVCWKVNESGDRDGPYCPNCVDEGKERRLNAGAPKGVYSCVHHKSSFKTAEYDSKPIKPPRLRSDFG
jgi:hypothetical protein